MLARAAHQASGFKRGQGTAFYLMLFVRVTLFRGVELCLIRRGGNEAISSFAISDQRSVPLSLFVGTYNRLILTTGHLSGQMSSGHDKAVICPNTI
jgi:hypothetical protein